MVTTLGSLTGTQCATRSANRMPTSVAYSANRSAVSRFSQPPSSSSGWGRSQWNSVAIGAMPLSRSSSSSRS